MKRWLGLAISVSMLVGCSSSVETRILSSGEQGLRPASFMLSEKAPQTPEMRNAQTLVAEKLVERGFVSSDTGLLNLEVTLAVRPAILALGNSTDPASLAKAKRKKPLQNCDDQEYRLGVGLTRVSDGALLYRGTAAEYHCNMPLAQALPELVDAVLADLGKPRGSYAVKRQAQD